MNEEISVTLRNNTSQIQPVSLFTEAFAIPSNITGGNSQIFSWDISSETYTWLFSAPAVRIKIDTIPINNSSPTYSAPVLSFFTTSVVSALNTLGFDTFTNIGDIISVNGNGTYFYGELALSPSFSINVNSTVPAIGLPPALEVLVNGNVVFVIGNGISIIDNIYFTGRAGDSVVVNYRAGAGATNWAIDIANYQGLFIDFLLSTSGVGAVISSFSFTYPPQGNMLIQLTIS